MSIFRAVKGLPQLIVEFIGDMRPLLLPGRLHVQCQSVEFFGRLFQSFFHLVFVQGHFDGRMELFLLERFEEIAEGLGDFGPLQGLLIRERGEIDHRFLIGFPDPLGSLDAVEILQGDIHKDKMRSEIGDILKSLFPGCGRADHLMAQVFHHVLDVPGDNVLIFDNQDANFFIVSEPLLVS